MGSTRESLLRLSNTLLDALARGDAGGVPRSPTCRYTENGETLDLATGVFATATGLRFRHVIADARSSQAAILAVVQEGEALAVYGLRMRAEDGQAVELEAVVARKGQASAFAPERLLAPNPVYDEVVPPDLRTGRDQLRAAHARTAQRAALRAVQGRRRRDPRDRGVHGEPAVPRAVGLGRLT